MKPIPEQSFYEILEIPQDAPEEEIELAYQRAKALYGPGSLATYSLVAPEEMALLNRRIEEARKVLLDAGTRAGYDASLPDSPGQTLSPPPSGPPPSESPLPAAAPAEPVATSPVQPAEAAPPGPTSVAEAAPPAAAEAAAEGAAAGAAAEAVPPEPQVVPPEVDVAAAIPEPASLPPRAIEPPAPVPAVPIAAPAVAPVAAAARAGFSAPEGAAWTGEMLRQAREGRGLTLHQLAERTKVARHHLENIEADRHRLLPAPVYLRGILISLAKELRLDPQKVSRSYLEGAQAAEAQPAAPKPR
ncbi:MAG TPA: helix-turn-helix domain-containing protein [Anaeromyxobacteraceae bacterium]|nr:helix-turn-helix domain-containing protein [Anaeromyxobacteraceae bacterium]